MCIHKNSLTQEHLQVVTLGGKGKMLIIYG